MKGLRTLGFNLIAAILPVMQSLDLTSVLDAKGMAIYGAVVAVANIALRTVTTTAIGKSS